MWLSNVKLILVDRIIENGALRIVDDKIVEITESSGQPSGVTVFQGARQWWTPASRATNTAKSVFLVCF